MDDQAIIQDLRRRLAEASERDDARAEELRRVRDSEQAVLFELQHRVRNMLATLRSIIARSCEGSDNVEDFAAHLVGRLDALARTQTRLTAPDSGAVDLETLVRDEMLAQVAPHESFELEGPDVALPERTANLLTLALHELGTNAMKFGALAVSDGSLRISWHTDVEDGLRWLHFVWEEGGVRVASVAPRRVGFGTDLIEQRIAYELRGRGSLELRPGGVRCTIDVPLEAKPPVQGRNGKSRGSGDSDSEGERR